MDTKDFAYSVRNIKRLVKRALEVFPETRNKDKVLLMKIWEAQGLDLTEKQVEHFLLYCSTPETVTRARREMQAMFPELQASTSVKQARLFNQKQMQSAMRK